MQRKKTLPIILFLILILVLIFTQTAQAQDEGPVIQAVLFYSESCPHCHQVINEVFPLLFAQYGDQLEIFYINTQSEKGSELFSSAIEYYEIPSGRRGVPTLVVGDTVLVGSGEIPAEFPAIIEEGLEKGGISWPELPGLEDEIEKAVARLSATAQAYATAQTKAAEGSISTPIATQVPKTESPSSVALTETPIQLNSTAEVIASPVYTTQEENSESIEIISLETDPLEVTIAEKFKRDLVGNIIAVVVLGGMVWSIVMVGIRTFSPPNDGTSWPLWVIPALSVVGIVVAGYLSYVEITLTEAVCGPVGDCNTVQQSQYARLFGVLPIGVLGLAGLVAILVSWTVQHYGPQNLRALASLALFGMTLFGTLFSIYLTFLEPFVIGATCAWCLASAVVMTLQLWASTGQLS